MFAIRTSKHGAHDLEAIERHPVLRAVAMFITRWMSMKSAISDSHLYGLFGFALQSLHKHCEVLRVIIGRRILFTSASADDELDEKTTQVRIFGCLVEQQSPRGNRLGPQVFLLQAEENSGDYVCDSISKVLVYQQVAKCVQMYQQRDYSEARCPLVVPSIMRLQRFAASRRFGFNR